MASPYFEKCKRLRTDGPTPCLCCPAECVGDRAEFDGHHGFYPQRVNYSRAETLRAWLMFLACIAAPAIAIVILKLVGGLL
jgi:hypothetical protein